MPWDNTKDTAADPDNPNADEQLTADEWNQHVDDGHWPSDELNVGVDNGDPVLTDPQNGDQVVLRYDRSAGSWVVDTLEAGSANTDELNNKPATVTWGDSGEYVVLGISTFGSIDASTTNSTYTSLTNFSQTATLSFMDRYLSSNLTTYIGWDIYNIEDIAGSTGDTVYARISDRGAVLDGASELEISLDDSKFRLSSSLYQVTLEDLQYQTGRNTFDIEGKADGDAECAVRGVPQIYVFGEVA